MAGVERDVWGHLLLLCSCRASPSQLPSTLSRGLLIIPRDRDSTAFLDNPVLDHPHREVFPDVLKLLLCLGLGLLSCEGMCWVSWRK